MSTFGDALRRGQRAARDAESARAEIDAVLKDFANQVEIETEGAISITFSQAVTLPFAMSTIQLDPRAVPPSSDEVKWITAHNSAKSDSAHLGKWIRPHSGYPCTLAYNAKEIRCHNREALEKGLIQLLQDPWVGEVITSLLPQFVIGDLNDESGETSA